MNRRPLAVTACCVLIAAGGALAGACSDDNGGAGFTKGDDLVIVITPNPVSFSAIAVGAHAERTVTIEHAGGSGLLKLKSMVLESDSTELTLELPTTMSLEPHTTTSFVVNYDPVDALGDHGTIVIETNVPSPGGGAVTMRVPVDTLSQAGFLRALPNPVDFGGVSSGASGEKTVTLLNVGKEAIAISDISVVRADESDFALGSSPTMPATVGPDESISFAVTYAPTGGGNDEGQLSVKFAVGGVNREIEPNIKLTGREVGPRLVAFPNPIDFGWKQLGASYEQHVTLSNQGERDLVITALALSAGSSGTLTLLEAPAGGAATLAPSAVLPLKVRFTPATDMLQTTGPIGQLVVTSNDPVDAGTTAIQIFGRAELPLLQVNPPDLVDFGYCAQNVMQERKVSLYNAGSSALTVHAVTLAAAASGEFELVEDTSWGPTTATPSDGTLAPTGYREVRVRFTNKGAASGIEWAKLVITSDDGQKPTWEVNLKAQRAGSPTCEVTLVPGQLDYGTVARGAQRKMTVNLINTGSGDCSFHSAFVNDCGSFSGFFEGACDDPGHTIQMSGTSDYYKVTRTPIAAASGLRPGQSYPIEVTFTPPDSAPLFGDEMTDYAGLLAVRIIDPYSGSNTPVLYPKPVTGTLSPYPPNLHAKSGIAQLAVLPQAVDFGLTTIGCHSQTIEVTAYNVGSAPLDLTDIQLQGCTPEFRIKASPGLPSTLALNGSEQVSVVYVPQDLGADECGLAFYTNNEVTPTIVVPLSGQGTFASEHTDRFTQTTGQDVDVLFVVDNSGSMDEEQSNLATNFQSFIQAASTWHNDYHIGVTSTDLEADSGRLIAGAVADRFVTAANFAAFANNVRLGTNGSGDEKGLATAQAALSLPNTGDSSTACSTDGDCAAPEKCVANFCGGRNRGFMRPDAALEIVFVSDEEDSSPGDLNFYINFFKSIKGFYNTNLMHAHAIVGDVPGGCSSGAGSAAAGQRYVAVAQATGGSVVSICDANFAAGLASIGNIAFGLRKQFFLARLPDPSTITVKVANVACAGAAGANWVYDGDSNSVVFDEGGGCMPQAGQVVEIHYETVCFLE